MQQQTEEWLEFRKGKISASKSPIILGVSPYQTPLQLFEEELGLREKQKSTPWMTKGLEIEINARNWFLDKTGINMTPDVVSSQENPLFIASLDGVNHEHKCILEIKNNNISYHMGARNGKIPEFHMIQVQHQLYVTGYNLAYYLSWRGENEVRLIKIERDEKLIQQIVRKGIEFKYMLDNLIEPELTENDYVEELDSELRNYIERYRMLKESMKADQKTAEEYLDKIKEIANGRNLKCHDFKLTKYHVKGRLDYDRIIQEMLVDKDLECYRKPSNTCYRISVA